MTIIVLPDVSKDERLLEEARANNREAQRLIYERYFPPIFQFILLRVDDHEQAQDIAADVFLDFFVALEGKSPPRTHLRAWLFRVARNKIHDHYGQLKRLPTMTLEEWVPDTNAPGPEAAVFGKLNIERVKHAIKMLVTEQQEVLVLRFGQGLNLQETADLMDKSTSAVKSLQFRAVDNLKNLLNAGEAE